jgi:hypothetical protein
MWRILCNIGSKLAGRVDWTKVSFCIFFFAQDSLLDFWRGLSFVSVPSFSIFTKWNECLFEEQCTAYESGRSGQDPAIGWYESELDFFDNYVIPLARKLQACEAFGVASNECLSYAIANRDEWAGKGETLVLDMVENYQKRKKELEQFQGLEQD